MRKEKFIEDLQRKLDLADKKVELSTSEVEYILELLGEKK